MPEITFTVPAVPVAQPRTRSSRGGHHYTPDNGVNAFKACVRLALREAYRGPPVDGPVSLSVTFVMPRTKRELDRKKHFPRDWHIKKPDSDNLVKAVKDALNRLAYQDDSQVCEVSIKKLSAAKDEQPHVEVTIKEATLTQEDD